MSGTQAVTATPVQLQEDKSLTGARTGRRRTKTCS